MRPRLPRPRLRRAHRRARPPRRARSPPRPGARRRPSPPPSKSGSTLEPNIFEAYFFERAKKVSGELGEKEVGQRFVAITDPGSKLEAVAKRKGFRRVFAGVPSIGGRFSALSNFGLVPAAAIGLDLERFTARAEEMAKSCAAPAATNPGLVLGAFLGANAKLGRDKLTL